MVLCLCIEAKNLFVRSLVKMRQCFLLLMFMFGTKDSVCVNLCCGRNMTRGDACLTTDVSSVNRQGPAKSWILVPTAPVGENLLGSSSSSSGVRRSSLVKLR